VNPNDYSEIGDALDRLISDTDLRRNLRKNGLHHAAQFTWKRCAEQTYEFYKTVVGL
jgi:glycosyltransferase involved in cell wall biosynthesis